MKRSEIFHNVQLAITSLLQAFVDFCIAERAINLANVSSAIADCKTYVSIL